MTTIRYTASRGSLIADTLVAMVPYITLAIPGHPTRDEKIAARVAWEERKRLKPYVTYIVEHTTFAPSTIQRIWNESDQDWIVAFESVEGTEQEKQLKSPEEAAVRNILNVARQAAEFEPSESPRLNPGERRLRFPTWDGFMKFVAIEWDTILDKHDTVIRLALDGYYEVDVVAKTPSDEVRRIAGMQAQNAAAAR